LREEILRYLSAHPDASDNLEGITRFWIARQRIHEATEKVESALEALVEEGLLEKSVRQTAEGDILGVRYCLKKIGYEQE